MKQILDDFQQSLMQPTKVAFICVIIGTVAVLYDGSLYRYWSLQKTETEVIEKIAKIQSATRNLRSQIELTQQPDFIEKQARENLDLVGDDEIVFIFSDDEER